MRFLRRKEDMIVVEEEARYKKAIATHPIESNIELF